MRPVSLEVEGIRSFRTAQKIDFTDLSFFAILGDTGAGKSSILEAMSYALFNSPTWFDRGVKELMTTGSSAMRVKFTFSIGGNECTITRMTPRTGAASHLLEYRGETPERCDSDNAVSRFVRERLRLDRETFMKTVMLPQGRFAELLLMKPADRSKFLSDVLGLYVIEAMAESVRIPRDETARRLDSLRGARRELPANAEEDAAAAMRASASAQADLMSIEESVRAYGVVSSTVQRDRSEAEAALASCTLVRDGISAVNELRALEGEDARMRDTIARFSLDREAADQKRSATAAAIEERRASGNDAATLRRHLADLQDVTGHRVRLVAERVDQVQAEAKISALQSELDRLASQVAELREREIGAEVDFEAAREESEVRRSRVAAVLAASKEIAAARNEYDRAGRELAEAEKAIVATESIYAAADVSFHERSAALEACAAERESARRTDSAAHAAHGLQAGDRCPVCDRTLPDPFIAPASPKLIEIERDFKAAESARDAAQRRLLSADATKRHAGATRERLSAELDARTKTLDSIVLESAMFDLSAVAENNGRVLAEESRRMAASEQDLLERKEKMNLARALREDADRDQVARSEALRAASNRLADAQMRAASVARSIEQTLAKLPEKCRPVPDSTDAEIDRIVTRVRSTLLEAELAEGSLAGDERAFSSAQDALQDANDAWLRKVERPRRDAFERLRPIVAKLLEPRGFPAVFPAPDGELPIIAAFTSEVSKALVSADEHFEAARLAAERRLVVLEASGLDMLRACGVDDMSSLQGLRDQRLAAATLAQQAILTAEVRQARVVELDRLLGLAEPAAFVYAELADSLTPAQFPKFLVERKQLELLRVGTTILGRMTSDRYGFSAGLGIVDRTINQERKAHTLSGGETFLASLALSLALVEISERAGVRFESLFLDEGFGTLDPAAFEQALIELEHQVSQGRMIAVITHVARVREFIDDVLHVTKTAEGSEVVREQVATAA